MDPIGGLKLTKKVTELLPRCRGWWPCVVAVVAGNNCRFVFGFDWVGVVLVVVVVLRLLLLLGLRFGYVGLGAERFPVVSRVLASFLFFLHFPAPHCCCGAAFHGNKTLVLGFKTLTNNRYSVTVICIFVLFRIKYLLFFLIKIDGNIH